MCECGAGLGLYSVKTADTSEDEDITKPVRIGSLVQKKIKAQGSERQNDGLTNCLPELHSKRRAKGEGKC